MPQPGEQLQPLDNAPCRMQPCCASLQGCSTPKGQGSEVGRRGGTCSSGSQRRRLSSASTRGRAARNCCRMPPGHDRSPGARGPPSAGVGSICVSRAPAGSSASGTVTHAQHRLRKVR